MDYRIAKQIRSAKFSDLVTANIVQGTSTIGSFQKALSQKAKARATRIKEKFDPLNIIKFMTGGSKLAPAILGRMLGRSQRDIEYFSGTARLIGGRNTKIGPVEKQGTELGILTEIYKFLNKSYEYEKKQRDLQSDYAEERKLEEEKRHKELIAAIKSSKTYEAVSDKKAAGGGFMDMIKNMFENLKKSLGPLIERAIGKLFGGMQNIGKLLRFLGTRVFGLLLGPLAIVGSITALVALLAYGLKNAIQALPDFKISQEQALYFLQNASNYDLEKLSKSFRGGVKEIEETAFKDTGGPKAILERNDPTEIEKYGGREFLEDYAKRQQVTETASREPEKVPPKPKLNADGTATGAVQRDRLEWDRKYGGKYDPETGYKLQPGYEDITAPQPAAQSSTPAAPAAPAAPPQMGPFNRMPGTSVTPMAIPTSSSAAGANLNPAMDENRDLRMRQSTAGSIQQTPASPTVQTVASTPSPVVQKPAIPAVRNLEESFQRMIYNSIRVV